MVGNSKSPDLLTNRALLEGLCRAGKEAETFGLLEELKRRRCFDERTYAKLLDGLKWICQDSSSSSG